MIGQEMPLDVVVPGAGRNIVELAIDPLPGELTETNNRAIALIDGIRENLRVLLVSGEPHAGERTWRNLLKSDASVDLVHFTILRPPEKQDGTPINELSLIAFPTRELFVEKINDFDLIIFDRYQHRDVLPILYYDYIAEYVEKGGALLIAAGPEYAGEQSIAHTPLIAALPGLPSGEVVEQGFYPRLTDTGKRHPVTRGLEGSASEPPHWSRWFRLIGIDQPEGEVVMKGPDDKPLLVLNRKGEGRVGMFLSDQGWLWARGFEGGGPHVALYRRIAHWLMKEPELEEERLTASGRGMTLDIRRQTMQDDPGPARVITPTGKTIDVTLASESPRRLHRQRQGRRNRPLPDRQWRPEGARPCRPDQCAGIRRHGVHHGGARSGCRGERRLGPAAGRPDRHQPARHRSRPRQRRRFRPRLDRPQDHRQLDPQGGAPGAALCRLLRPCSAALRPRLHVVPRGALAATLRLKIPARPRDAAGPQARPAPPGTARPPAAGRGRPASAWKSGRAAGA